MMKKINSFFRKRESMCEIEQLREILVGRQLQVTDVQSDGSCLFSALGLQVGQSGSEIRQELLDYMSSHINEVVPEHVRSIVFNEFGGFEEYLRKMSQPSTYGDGIMISVASKYYRRPVIIYHADGSEIVVSEPGTATVNPIRLGYIRRAGRSDRDHYVSIEPKSDDSGVSESPSCKNKRPHYDGLHSAVSKSSTSASVAYSQISAGIVTAEETAKGDVCDESVENTDKSEIAPDIGLHYQNYSHLSCNLKYSLLKNPWKPNLPYAFPVVKEGSQNRHFLYSWLSRYKWLVYSPTANGAFCKFCVLFANRHPSCGTVGALVVTPFQKYKKAKESFDSHERTVFHNEAVGRAEQFITSVERGTVVQIGNKAFGKHIENNRRVLKSIVETIIFCARQNIPLRGHRDDGALDGGHGQQEGSFRELLKFRISCGDKILESHIKNASDNATMISKTTQNELIRICGQVVVEEIVNDILSSGLFAVMADETTDISTKEQMSIVLRYATSTGICESFVGFLEVPDTTGATLANKLLSFLSELGLDPMNLRGQGYDGASNMSGGKKGVQALILEKNPLAVYTHCCNHVLNLVIVKSCSIPEVRNMFGVVQKVAVFFGESAKRMKYLQNAIDSSHAQSEQVKNQTHNRLKKHCQTRWIEQADALLVFLELMDSVLDALGTISSECDSATAATAYQLIAAILQFPFLVAIFVASTLLNVTKPLSVILQKAGLDMCSALSEVKVVQKVLTQYRENSVNQFGTVFAKAVNVGEKYGIMPKVPRVCGRQTNRVNVECNDNETYYRVSVYLPFLDHLIGGLSERFDHVHEELALASKLVPALLIKGPALAIEERSTLAHSFPDILSPNSFSEEYDRWYHKWTDSLEAASNITGFSSAMMEADSELYPSIYTVLKVSALRPSSTAGNERCFSALKLLKNYLRANITAERLSGLALLYIHRNKDIDIDNVIERFARLGPHRLAFLN